jgi:hypothetical protein
MQMKSGGDGPLAPALPRFMANDSINSGIKIA